MKNRIKQLYILLLTGTALMVNPACKTPYVSPASSVSVNLLHIEGFINTSGDTCVITLSRTVKLSDSVGSNPELHAAVTVEGNDGSAYPLTETTNGNYIYPDFSAISNSTHTYRLKIITNAGKTYESDFVAVKNSPPIDSVYFQTNTSGLQIYSSTHDPANATRYYRWDYAETWIQESDFDSFFEAQTTPTDTIVPRPPGDQIYHCWVTDNSSTIILNSSAKLSQDIIAQNLITSIGSLSQKFAVEYSILLSQYALTEDAFNYWQNLKTNTEQLGGIFDAQPSEIQGNVHCVTTPSEVVLGYVSAGSVAKQRIFIGGSSMPMAIGSHIPSQYVGCTLDTLYYNSSDPATDVVRLYLGNPLPINGLFNPFTGKFIGYTSSTKECVDCRAKGGTNQRPAYWIDKY